MKILAWGLVPVLLLGLAGCGGDEEPSKAEPTAPPSSLPAGVGTVQGQLAMVGGPRPGTAIPVSGKLKIVGTGTSIRADIGEDGKYAIQLAPGSYRITATSPKYQNSDGVCRTSPASTEIAAGKTVTADIICVMK